MDKWQQTFFDVTARKPSGWLGKLMYGNPVGHYGFFRVAVGKLQLQPEDVFLEAGCGGGILLDMALQTVQRACGIDHSPDMVELARQKNAHAVRGACRDCAGQRPGFTLGRKSLHLCCRRRDARLCRGSDAGFWGA